MKNEGGFTLLEVLIALGIVAVISILSWQGLNEVLRSTKRVAQIDQNIQILTAVFSQFEKDLSELELQKKNHLNENDWIEISGNGLLLRKKQRRSSEPAYYELVEWVLDGGYLKRTTRSKLSSEKVSRSEPIPMKGFQIRFFKESIGWTAPTVFGHPSGYEHDDLDLQGLELQESSVLKFGWEQSAKMNDGQFLKDESTSTFMGSVTGVVRKQNFLVRAVEVSLTQPNMQTVTQIFLTGGVH
jgi:prepilin-type N-terminal cleavage/methylation domain-containing protein